MKEHIFIAVTAGFLLDLIFGDPPFLYHPVRIIGKLISLMERIVRRLFPGSKAGLRAGGAVLASLVCLISTAVPCVLLRFLYHLSFPAGLIVETFWCFQLLAAKSLRKESMKVYDALQRDDTEAARRAVSMIVGRDTSVLDRSGIIRAAVETVAENASDGEIAPLFYMMIGGAAGGFFYKSINTMDSMIGYRNEKYRYLGTAAARMDDAVNFLPSRLSGLLFVAAAGISGFDMRGAWKIFRRDRLKHASPNSAQTESAAAGALDIQLAGDAVYFGEVHHKPKLGDPVREIEAEDIPRVNRLMYMASVLAIILFAAVRICVLYCLH